MHTVSSIIKRLIQQEPYYGIFACGLNKEFTSKIQTACVCLDGINYKLLINQDFWNSLTPNIRYGIIKHELLHLVFYHVVDVPSYHELCPDHDMLNIAMDMEVQSYIDEPYRWKEAAAEKLFAEFPNVPRALGTKFYINFLQQIKEYANDPSAQLNSRFKSAQTNWDTVRNLLNNPNCEHGNWADNSDGSMNSDAKESLVRNQIDYQQKESARSVEKSRGTIPAELKEMIEKLLKPAPPVFNWKAYFRRLLGIAFDIYQKKTRRKESERFEGSPGLKRKKKHKLLVAIDTSGSVCDDELREFFSEIYHIWKAGADVHILECDAKITKEYDYNGKMPDYITGRGGTMFSPCVDYYNDHRREYTTMVYFTDGYGDQDLCEPLNKMLWVITSNGNQSGSFPGVKICIPKNNKL